MQEHTSRSFSGVYGDVSNSSMGMGVIVFSVCWLAVSQVMSMQRTTFCLQLRSSRATLSGKTSTSGCCCSEAKSSAQWEGYFVLLFTVSVPVEPAYTVCWDFLSVSLLFIDFQFAVCIGAFLSLCEQYPRNNHLNQWSSYNPVFLVESVGPLVKKKKNVAMHHLQFNK